MTVLTSPEYVAMVGALQKCKQRAKSCNDVAERRRRMAVEEIFGFEYDIENEEYLSLRQSQEFKVHLFDSMVNVEAVNRQRARREWTGSRMKIKCSAGTISR